MRKNPASETVLAFVCMALIGYFIFEQKEFLFAALGIGLLGLLSKKFSQLLHGAWSFLSEKIGGVMSALLLSLVFFVILSPVAFLFRLFSKETPFYLPKDEKSTFSSRGYSYTQKDLKNPW